MKKKLLSAVLAVVLVFTSADVTAFAQKSTNDTLLEEIVNEEEPSESEVSENRENTEEEIPTTITSDIIVASASSNEIPSEIPVETEEPASEENTSPSMTLPTSEDDLASGFIENDKDGVSWVVDSGGKLTIKGKGEIFTGFHTANEMPWFSVRSNIVEAVIDLSEISDVSYLLSDCRNLTKVDMSNFDAQNVTNMRGMFYYCSSLQDVDFSGVDTSNVKDMTLMFAYTAIMSADVLAELDTSSVENVANMFAWCRNLRGISVQGLSSDFPVSAYGMFQECDSLEEVNLSNLDTSNITNMESMFFSCEALEKVTLRGIDAGNVSSMKSMFEDCGNLKEVDMNGLNLQNVLTMELMFDDCDELVTVDMGGLNTEKLTNMGRMFFNCESLTELNVKDLDTGNVTDMSSLFSNCEKLEKIDLSSWDTTNVESMLGMFDMCENLTEINLNGITTPKLNAMALMFHGCKSLKSLDISNFDTTNVTGMNSLFHMCHSLEELNITGLDTKNVTNMSDMFNGCNKLAELDVTGFDTKKVVYMDGMFSDCENLTELDVRNFSTANVSNMRSMFASCKNLKVLDLGSFDLKNTYSKRGMLAECDALEKVYSPRNCSGEKAELPGTDADVWYFSDGSTTEILPEKLSYTLVIARNVVPDPSEDRIPPMDTIFEGIEINGKGIGYAHFILKNDIGYIQKNTEVLYNFGGEEKTAVSDKNGYVTLESPVLTNTTGVDEEVSLETTLKLVTGENETRELGYKIFMEIVVKPLSFSQQWELCGEGTVKGSIGAQVGAKAGVGSLEASLAAVEIEGTLGGSLSVEHAYEDDGSRTLTLFQSYNAEVAASAEAGIAGEAAVLGKDIELTAVSVSGEAAAGGTTGIGMRIEDYDPTSTEDLLEVGKFMLAMQAQATNNLALTQIAEKLGFDTYNLSEKGATVVLGAEAGAGSLNVGDKDIGTLANIGAGRVFSYSDSTDKLENTREVTFGYERVVENNFLSTSILDRDVSVFSDSPDVTTEISGVRDSDSGKAQSFSIKKEEKDTEGFILEKETAEAVEISYDDVAIEKLAEENEFITDFINGNTYFVFENAQRELFRDIDRAEVEGSYAASVTEREFIEDIGIDVGVAAVVGLEAAVNLEGGRSYEYETASGTYVSGERHLMNQNDISEMVREKAISLEQLIEEPLATIGGHIKSFIEDVSAEIKEGVTNGWAQVKSAIEETAKKWDVHIIRIGNEEQNTSAEKSYAISVYTQESANVALANETEGTRNVAYTVGEPYCIYVTDENEDMVSDYTESPLVLTLSYSDSMLEEAGMEAEKVGNLAIYRYEEEIYGYICVGGEIDWENKKVSQTIIEPGQYVLAVDTKAPTVTRINVSDTTSKPIITVYFDEKSGFSDFSMKIDDTECISSENWMTYYDGNRGVIEYEVVEELEDGEHTIFVYAVDTVGNAMDSPVTGTFTVDTIVPAFTDVKLAISEEKLRVRAWSADTDIKSVTAQITQVVTDDRETTKEVASEVMLDLMEGYYTGLITLLEDVEYVSITLTAYDVNGNKGVIGPIEKTKEVLEENVENDLWVRFVDGDGVTKNEYTYMGKAIKPQIEIYEGTTLLSEKKDYTVSYKNNTNAGQGTITVTGKGNYKGTETVTFTIQPKDISDETDESIVISEMTAVLNGREQKPVPKITYNKRNLSAKKDKDFTVTYPDTGEGAYTEASAMPYTIHVKGNGNYTGERDIPFYIGGKKTSKLTVKGIKNRDYTGSEITFPDLVVMDGRTVLVKEDGIAENPDYRVSYRNNIDAGTASIVIEGIAPKCVGTKTVTFKINGISMKKAVIDKNTLPKSVVYDGKEHCPELVLTYQKDKKTEKETLIKGTDYDIEYSKNVDAGTASIVITGKNRFAGTVKKTFKIQPFDANTNVDDLLIVQEGMSVVYSKGGAKVKPLVKFGSVILAEGKDYTLSYANNKAVTMQTTKKQPTVTVKFKGNYKNSLKTNYIITPQSLANVKSEAPDKVYSSKKNAWKAVVTLTDLDGKKLKSGTDYEKNLEYFLDEACTKKADAYTYDKDTSIYIKVTGKGNYADSSVVVDYEIKAASITKAKVKIKDQIYTGKEVVIDYDDITSVTVGRDKLEPVVSYEIVPGSYQNNIKKGTASVQIKGIGNYGGTVTAKFKIGQKWFLWRVLFGS